MQGARVWFLVRELRSHVSRGAAKFFLKKKEVMAPVLEKKLKEN